MLKSRYDDIRDGSHATTRLNFDLGDVLTTRAHEAHTSPAMIVARARLLVDYHFECGL